MHSKGLLWVHFQLWHIYVASLPYTHFRFDWIQLFIQIYLLLLIGKQIVFIIMIQYKTLAKLFYPNVNRVRFKCRKMKNKKVKQFDKSQSKSIIYNFIIFQSKMIKLRLMLTGVVMSYVVQSRKAEEDLIEMGSILFWVYAGISFLLSCFAGVCSGLTVGYMAINKAEMELWASSGSEEEKKIAKPILEILSNHHQLLSTLLLANALSLQSLPIFLDKLVPQYMAIIISTCAVVVFGEVIPQAYCTGHHKVKIGYYASGFIKALECLLYIFVMPIVYVLDNWLGHHQQKITLTKENINAILYLHNSREYGYRPEEIEILQNTMDLRTKIVKNDMIKLQDTVILNEEAILDDKMFEILEKGNFSKIPVYRNQPDNVIGYLKVKNLIVFSLNENKKLKDGNIITPIVQISEGSTLLQTIDSFRTNKTNFAAVVHHETKKCLGIITLKQIFEKLVLKEFNDSDVRVKLNLEKKGVLDQVIEGKEQD